MAEIAENLHRRELGEIERAELMARWVEITAAKQEQDAKEAAAKAQADEKPGQVGPVYGKGGRGKKGGINQAARELGVPATQVKRAVKIAALSPEAKRLAKKLKAPQAVLLEAAKHDVADDQVAGSDFLSNAPPPYLALSVSSQASRMLVQRRIPRCP